MSGISEPIYNFIQVEWGSTTLVYKIIQLESGSDGELVGEQWPGDFIPNYS